METDDVRGLRADIAKIHDKLETVIRVETDVRQIMLRMEGHDARIRILEAQAPITNLATRGFIAAVWGIAGAFGIATTVVVYQLSKHWPP